jgi:hypothetical protein
VASASQSPLRLNAKPPERRRRSFHRRYHKLILAARILLGAAIVVGTPAVSHFAYNAVHTANCYTETVDIWGNSKQVAVRSDNCANLLDSENHMRLDAGLALVGVAFLLSSVVCYRRARRYRSRAPIRPVRQP